MSSSFQSTSRNNYLSNELLKIIKPLYITDCVIISNKFRLKRNCITPNTKLYSFFSILANISFVSLHFIRNFVTGTLEEKYFAIGFVFIANIVLVVIEYIVNVASGILRSESIVDILLKLQSIDDILQDKEINKFEGFKRWTHGLLFSVLALQTFIATSNARFFVGGSVLELFLSFNRFFFDTHLIYSVFIVDFLTSKLNLWSSKLEALADAPQHVSSTDLDDRVDSDILFSTFRCILRVVQLTEQVFSWHVS
ncbi:hypothetical protein JYU34_015403 [Plutella xylostella]|uniref:Gustatory receptor n=1 Tax=Plutella xylostella TaxID=51655 RepID=A0ABQ7Q722_PLUXY|nr:hypothetical protein JYU34_015403 [Plutella xylostella]